MGDCVFLIVKPLIIHFYTWKFLFFEKFDEPRTLHLHDIINFKYESLLTRLMRVKINPWLTKKT